MILPVMVVEPRRISVRTESTNQMGKNKGLFRIFVMNLSGSDSFNRWNESVLHDVADRLTNLFAKVVAHPSCPFSDVAWFSACQGCTRLNVGINPNLLPMNNAFNLRAGIGSGLQSRNRASTPGPSDVLVYFVATHLDSIVAHVGGPLSSFSESGLTSATTHGVISEVWLAGSPNDPMNRPLSDTHYKDLLANVAFHELMHNKLDALQSGQRALSNIHDPRIGGGGLAAPMVSANTHLTIQNIEIMAQNLDRPIPQYSGATAGNFIIVGDSLTSINGNAAPQP